MSNLALFDTNILIDLFNGREEAANTFEDYNGRIAISLISWIEVLVGAKKVGQENATRAFLDSLEVIEISHPIAERSIELRQAYRMKLPDAIILATAQIHSRCLVTRNIKDFASVTGVFTPYQ
ncbi:MULTISPECIES: type II toxin-antitoxin system VapC family toxin [Kosakonia]|nr:MULTISPECIES: type II toxin-antitoxin system VapC family toxin [Kosakonia]MBK0081265.1 type II toxin-antitoxin system VapC family toxin [Kosakonia sp. S57]MBK0088258.1 type II toxin-antitoxin system VapC family toxin [Kosakonia sp. S58]